MIQPAPRPIRFATLALALLGLAACDVSDPLEGVDLVLDLPDAPLELSESAGTVPVRSGETSATNSTVANETDVKEVQELRTVELDPSFFSFESSAAAVPEASGPARAAASTGTLEVAVFFNGVPIPGTPVQVTVTDGEVTDVQPRSLNLLQAAVDGPALSGLLSDLPGDQQPDLAEWEEMSVAEIVARINQGLASSDVPISVVLRSDGLEGSFRFHRFEFDARVSLSR